MKSTRIFLSLLMAIYISILVIADAEYDGTIYGHVYDADTMQPLSQAFVYCQEAKSPKQVTDGKGYYANKGDFLPLKNITIKCSKYNYRKSSESISTNQQGKAEVDFYLQREDSDLDVESQIITNATSTNLTVPVNVTIERIIVPIDDAIYKEVLKADSGKDLSQMNLTMYSTLADFGTKDHDIGIAVKFTSPHANWKLHAIGILGWNGFNGMTSSIPPERNFLIEIRDRNLDLLYSKEEVQNSYFNFPAPTMNYIITPVQSITGDFYVIFYDRGSMRIGCELDSITGNSYFFYRSSRELAPAELSLPEKVQGINWIMRAVENQ